MPTSTTPSNGRVVNSAEYGFPQRRKRVYIFCEKNAGKVDLVDRMHNGVMAKAFPAIYPDEMSELDGFARPLRELNSVLASAKRPLNSRMLASYRAVIF